MSAPDFREEIASAKAHVMYDTQILPMERNILYIVLDNSDELHQCHLQQVEIAKIMRVSRKTVYASVQRLRRMGKILVYGPERVLVAWPFCSRNRSCW